MIFTPLSHPDLVTISPKVFSDERGYFYEIYSQKEFDQNGIKTIFVQDNQSFSNANILRGLHLQLPPFTQDKLVRVTQGTVIDIAVDARPNSPHYQKFEMVELSAENHLMFYIPQGFLHGFVVTQGPAIFQYKVSQYYNKESELAVLWNDPTLNINWPISTPTLSSKDNLNPVFTEIESKLSVFK